MNFLKDFKNWMILKTLYNKNENFDLKEDNSSKSNSSLGNSKQLYSTNKIHLSKRNNLLFKKYKNNLDL